jgi:LuxR family transcriptional regulator, transcriptional regulator of spore coat protein
VRGSYGQPLTERQLDVLELVSEGYSDEEIGGKLGIARKTVRNHLDVIRVKLEARNRAHVVSRAARLGLLDNG